MKRWQLMLLSCICLFIANSAQGQVTGGIRFGSNWFNATAKALNFDTVFNTYHMTGDSIMLAPWLSGAATSDKTVVGAGLVYDYSAAERMLYQAELIPTNKKALEHWYFSGRNNSIGDTSQIGSTIYWKVNASTTSHSDDTILWHNQYSGAWKGDNPGPLKLAFKLRIADTATGTSLGRDSAVIRVVLKEHYNDSLNSDSVITIGSLSIKWDSIHTTGDTVIFQQDSIGMPHRMNLDFSSKDGGKGLELEVYSRRYVTVRIAWVCIENTPADRLLAGFDLDPSNSAKRLQDSITKAAIIANDIRIENYLSPHFLRHYISDEPSRSQYAAQNRINTFIIPHSGYVLGNAAADSVKIPNLPPPFPQRFTWHEECVNLFDACIEAAKPVPHRRTQWCGQNDDCVVVVAE